MFAIIFSAYNSYGQNSRSLWQSIEKVDVEGELLERKSEPNRATFFDLNIQELKEILQEAPSRKETTSESNLLVDLPNSQGVFETYRIKEASIMAPELQEKFPDIKSYVGTSINDKNVTVRFSVSPKGLHAMFFGLENGVQFIDPYTSNASTYIAYAKKNLSILDSDFLCEVDDTIDSDRITSVINENGARNNDGSLRTYRLAVACTGEYGVFHGGTVAGALAAINTTMTRVNGIFEREVSLTMELVADNDQVIFTNPSTDPFTGNGNSSVLINESQTVIDADFASEGYGIGNPNYDIGHTFSTGAGGRAQLNSPCVAGSKARGVTGQSSPIGDAFDVDYVAHEMGHQFGATHTFNGGAGQCGGNRYNPTAYEPGSGSTIMAYAGICSPQNVQNNSDDYFHIASLSQIWSNISSGCGAVSSSGNNNPPVISALTNYNIPPSTPFILKGNGSDADGDGLTYCWEQKDNAIANYPLVSSATSGPAFRSLPPSTSSDRYMPAIETVIAGNTSSEWEVVPNVNRTMNFDLTVRDNNSGGGRYITESMVVTVASSAPFAVTAPNAVANWAVGSTQTISWNIGSTSNATINCQNVNIKLSTDGGFTYPVTILSNTPNDGTQEITIPNNLSTTCRIMVEAADNIFYDISDENFIISTSGGATEYCPSLYTNPGSEYISNVTFSDLDNNSGDATTDGYEDFTGITASVEAGNSYTIEVTIDTEGNVTDHCNVFIDWNQNFIFEASELYDLGDVTNVNAGVLSTSISVPVNAINGDTRMRVSIESDNDPGACDSDHQIEWGETEDYTVSITGGLKVEEQVFEAFNIYPNPSNGSFNISMKLDSSEDVLISVYDILGKEIANNIYKNNDFVFFQQLNYVNLARGFYILKVKQGDKITSNQIIIK